MSSATTWWSEFFSGLALETVPDMFPAEYTRREADFAAKVLGLGREAQVLDVPCGAGRMCIELASRGHHSTGVDLVPTLVDEARRRANAGAVARATFVARDMRDLTWNAAFDAAVCLGNSFTYFDDRGNAAFLTAVLRVLKPGGGFLLHVPTVAECFLPNHHLWARSWHELAGIVCLRQSRIECSESRCHTQYTFLRGAEREEKEASYRIYGYRELVDLLAKIGFVRIEGHGSCDGEPFAFGAQDCYLAARRPT